VGWHHNWLLGRHEALLGFPAPVGETMGADCAVTRVPLSPRQRADTNKAKCVLDKLLEMEGKGKKKKKKRKKKKRGVRHITPYSGLLFFPPRQLFCKIVLSEV